MKNLLLLVCLFVVGVISAQAQISTVGSTRASANNGASQWSVQISPQAGDTLVVGCDYAVGVQFNGVSDTSGDSFSPLGQELDSAFAARAFIATNVHGGSTTVTCKAASSSASNEIYVTELKGVNPAVPVDSYAGLAGSSSTAKGNIVTSYPNEMVWAYIVTGHATDPSGWTKLSTYDGNLVSYRSQVIPGTVSASFPVTMGWTLVLVALEPAGTTGSGGGSSGSGSGSGGSPAPIGVSVSPSTASVQVSHPAAFSASLQNDTQNQGVTWSLSGSGCSGTTCGTLTNVTTTSVTYAAPSAVPSPAVVALTATSVADSTKSASAAITVTAPPAISVSVTPSSSSVQVSESGSFSASLQNDTQNKGVGWSLSGAGCSGTTCGALTNITSTSVTYDAPASVPSPAKVTLKATSVVDSTKSASATITVTTAPAISVAVTPPTASVQISQSANFSAALQNDSQNKGVSWLLNGSGCSGATCGTLTNVTATSVTYNAPATAPSPANVVLTATSVADTSKSAFASISITTPSNDPTTGGPSLVWSKSGANTTGDPTSSYTTNLPTAGTLPGNALIATFQYAAGSASSASVSDDKGDQLALLVSNNDGNQVLSTYCIVPTTGARVVTITFGGGSPQYVSLVNASEWTNVSCSIDTSSSNAGSAATLLTGSLATTSDGDLIYQVAVEDGPTVSETWRSGASPWTLLSASSGLSGSNTPQASQYQVQTTHGSISPSLSMSSADSWNTLAVALRPSSVGTAPAPGIHIVHLQEESVPPGLPGPYHLQFPSSGNLVITASVDTPNYDIISISDNNGNVHAQIGSPFNDGYTSGDLQTFYAANASTSQNLALTFSMKGSPVGGSTFFLYDISGASASPYDAAAGRQTATAKLGSGSLPGPTITASTPNGLVIIQVGVTTNSIDGISPGYFAGTIPNPLGQTNPTNQNNGWAFDFNTSATTIQYFWVTDPAGSQVDGWASTAVAFKAQ